MAVSDEVRDDLVGLGVAPPDKIVVIPYGFDLSGSVPPRRARARSVVAARSSFRPRPSSSAGPGRLTRDQASPRPRPDARRARGARGPRAYLVVVGDGPERDERRGPGGGARRARALPLPRLPPGHEPLVRNLRRLSPHLRERGNARSSRSRRSRASAPSWRRTPVAPATVVRDGVSGYLAPVGRDARRWPPGSTSSPRHPGLARSLGEGGSARRADGGSPRRRWPTPSTRSTEGSSTSRESPAHPQDHRDQRLGTSSPDAAARAARAGRRRPIPRPRRPRYRRTPLLRGARRSRRAVRARPVHDGPESSHGRRGDQGRSPKRSRPAPHPPRARGHLRLDRLDRDPGAVRLVPPQRRQVPARAVPPRRPAVRPPGAQDHRDLRRRPPLPRAGRSPAREARHGPLRARRPPGGAVRAVPCRARDRHRQHPCCSRSAA